MADAMFAKKKRIDLDTARSLVLGAFALGAGLVYFLDKQNGLQRRVKVREQLVRARERALEGIDKAKAKARGRTFAKSSSSTTSRTPLSASDTEFRDSLF